MTGFMRTKLTALKRKLADREARLGIESKELLSKRLQAYLQRTSSSGCGHADYWALYRQIRERKPREVLECGTGVSTIVIGSALLENEREGHKGRVTSLEEREDYFQLALRQLPTDLADIVDLVLSPTVEDCYSLFRGVRYRDVPERPFDFVFVDGPSVRAPSDGDTTFDFDFIHVLKTSAGPVAGLVDKRVSTCYVLQKLLGPDIVKYDAVRHLGLISPCSRHDLMWLDPHVPSSAFEASFRVIGNTELRLRLEGIPDER